MAKRDRCAVYLLQDRGRTGAFNGQPGQSARKMISIIMMITYSEKDDEHKERLPQTQRYSSTTLIGGIGRETWTISALRRR